MKHLKQLIFPAAIVAAVLVAYFQVFGAGINNWDDAEYVFDNPDITSFSSEHIRNWFTKYYIGNYHPLTMVSYALDWQLGGADPFWYHLTNILLHMINGVLVYVLAHKLTGHRRVGFLVALLFAVHPVQTESVSWIAERKNVLYGFFFLASCITYVHYLAKGNPRWLILAVVLGVCAMLSKAAALSLPVAFLALDIIHKRQLKATLVWMEKIPLIVAAVILGLTGIEAQKHGAFLNLHPGFVLPDKLIFAGYAFSSYIFSTFVPVGLSVWYPYPEDVELVHVAGLGLALLVIIAGIYGYISKQRILAGGILFFCCTIFLVLQFVQFGETLRADRYLYIPLFGLLLPAVYYPVQKWSGRNKKMVFIFFTVAAGGLMYLTYERNKIWLTEQNFWTSVLERYPHSAVAQYSLGAAYLRAGDYINAEPYINEAVRIEPNNHKAWYNKGILHLRQNRLVASLDALNRSLALQSYSKAQFTRALVYQQMGDSESALADAQAVLQSDPDNARVHFIVADALEQANKLPEAIHSYQTAIDLEPGEAMFYMRRGIALAKMKQFDEALHDLDRAIALNSSNGAYWYWRGMIRHHSGQNPCTDLEEALRKNFRAAQQPLLEICR